MIRRRVKSEDHPAREKLRGPTASLRGLMYLVTALMLLPSVLGAQPHQLSAPVDSPLWWTLSEDVTPAELHRLYNDRSTSLARYDAAVEAGLEEPLPKWGKRSRACLKFYDNPELTPELEPMWLAFDVFSTLRVQRDRVGVENELRKFEISDEGFETIMTTSLAAAQEIRSFRAEFAPKQIEIQLLIGDVYKDPVRAASAPPEKQVYNAVREQDYQTVAAVIGRPVSEIRDLVDSLSNWDASAELVAETLPVLKASLSDADWERFRHYLREVVVAGMGSSKHFDAGSVPTSVENENGVTSC